MSAMRSHHANPCADRRATACRRADRRPAARTHAGAALALVTLALATLLAGCGRESAGPEAEIRALLDAGERAAEARDVDALMALVSREYSDVEGRRRVDLERYVRGVLLLHPSLELLTHVEELTVESPEHARAVLAVAMVGRRGTAEASALAADAERVTLQLRRDGGEWRVIAARWQDRPL